VVARGIYNNKLIFTVIGRGLRDQNKHE